MNSDFQSNLTGFDPAESLKAHLPTAAESERKAISDYNTHSAKEGKTDFLLVGPARPIPEDGARPALLCWIETVH